MNKLETAKELLLREAWLLDSQDWKGWLSMYAPDCEYWVPARRSDETLTQDPNTELSHIYYANRAGLEDRVLRIMSGRSAASTPAPRTTHMLCNFHLEEGQEDDGIRIWTTWSTQMFNVRQRKTYTFFGTSLTEFGRQEESWLISRKRIELKNDYIPTFIDIYCF
ncbi:MAG: aromatic-ring-hydroxylating dioxygenase subunit beta [Pigmentiphaga sp.]|jgi:benzoate/toluate 1,2-dioxygenase beta subunit|uniref:Benzoate 1,2-dioxygenase small subunit n=1 Tax=Pigmentiphaga daeguensis TaxID=414049 RepID=A0ABN1D4R9_9BURK|nr:aromatic-ring-hydroxylating dioxygenase subunit beta [Pigmentiphaga sp. NML030171]OVZ66519.1 hypothetical protein CDO46_00280 [Pigmentiphaga sp. NML030171]